MVQDQLKAVRDRLMTEGNEDRKQSIYNALVEDAERGANMILDFAKEKELELAASPEDIVQAIRDIGQQSLDDEDIELSQEELANVSGGAWFLAAFLVKGFFAGAGFWASGKSVGVW